MDRNTEKRDVDLFLWRDERGELYARIGGGGKSGWVGEVETTCDGGLGVAQERWRWRSSARRVDISVSRM